MKITDMRKITPRSTTLNEIPVGAFFKGTIVVQFGTVTGIFYKANGPWRVRDTSIHKDCVVVRIDENNTGLGASLGANLWATCLPVHDYELLTDVELVIR